MNWSFSEWLAETEDMLWRMIRGTFRFAFRRMPEWVYRTLLDSVGPATIRLMRVAAVFCLWLAVVFGPAVFALKSHLPLWANLGAATWLALAIAGSAWGRSYLVTKRRGAETAGEANRPYRDGRTLPGRAITTPVHHS